MKEIEAKTVNMDQEKLTVCVLDASTYVGFWVLKGLLSKGYPVHAAIQKNGETEIVKKIRDMEGIEEKLVVSTVDVLDYHSILEAVKGCCALFFCLDSQDGYDDKMVEMEVRGAIDVVEACAQTERMEKIVFNSSLTAAIWRENICSRKDVDERSWSDQEFCRKKKLWYALAKTLSEQAAWALAMDRTLNMVSINAGLVLGPAVAKKNPGMTMSYLQGAINSHLPLFTSTSSKSFDGLMLMFELFEDGSTCGRYFCFDQIVNTEQEAVKLAESLSPLISLPPRYECHGREVYAERLRNKKLNKLVEDTASHLDESKPTWMSPSPVAKPKLGWGSHEVSM
ncbi:NAD(P)-binding Rossmann-fold superfamily protein [Actinidia rufa]|uniref:NAD(P)-binding Rossmann-fold superfamily protein n=1 Tax=Actinidia rufa TaxID=165716 RepID=A0A7J0FAB1_9ERIC|nr:NAD(P)-binding Rossmann-fold superfamily protein [Actinidia rufa]